jgi:hypothetical protein
MPRLARLDVPGVLHPVMGRGIERRKIFLSDTDRNDFIHRLSALVQDGTMEIYAWVLMPNHYQFRVVNALHERPLLVPLTLTRRPLLVYLKIREPRVKDLVEKLALEES